MPIGLILLIIVAAASVLTDLIVVTIRGKNIGKVAVDMSWGWKLSHNRLVINKDNLCMCLVSALLGVAHLFLGEKLGWIKYVGLGIAVLGFLYNLYRLVAFYGNTHGKLRKSSSSRHTFLQYLHMDIAGIKFGLYTLTMLLFALIWALFY